MPPFYRLDVDAGDLECCWFIDAVAEKVIFPLKWGINSTLKLLPFFLMFIGNIMIIYKLAESNMKVSSLLQIILDFYIYT